MRVINMLDIDPNLKLAAENQSDFMLKIDGTSHNQFRNYNGIEIDIDGIEDIPLGAGGKNLSPSEVIDMFNETGTLVYRRRNLGGEQVNYRPIQEIENGLGKDVISYYDIIQRNIQMIPKIILFLILPVVMLFSYPKRPT